MPSKNVILLILMSVTCGASFAADGKTEEIIPSTAEEKGNMPDGWYNKGANVMSQTYSGKLIYIQPKEKADPELVGKLEPANSRESYTLRATSKELQDSAKKLDGKTATVTGQLKDGVLTIWRFEAGASSAGKPVKKKGGL
jgi:hypothetical protein